MQRQEKGGHIQRCHGHGGDGAQQGCVALHKVKGAPDGLIRPHAQAVQAEQNSHWHKHHAHEHRHHKVLAQLQAHGDHHRLGKHRKAQEHRVAPHRHGRADGHVVQHDQQVHHNDAGNPGDIFGEYHLRPADGRGAHKFVPVVGLVIVDGIGGHQAPHRDQHPDGGRQQLLLHYHHVEHIKDQRHKAGHQQLLFRSVKVLVQ